MTNDIGITFEQVRKLVKSLESIDPSDASHDFREDLGNTMEELGLLGTNIHQLPPEHPIRVLAEIVADFRDEERRKEYVGVWADYKNIPVVITGVYWSRSKKYWVADLFGPAVNWIEKDVPFSTITPRFDLPRAWTTDGTPVKENRNG